MKNLKEKFHLKPGVQLFLLTLPFIAAYFIFCYVPLSGWAYSFFDYHAGFKLFDCEYVGLKHFRTMFQNPVLRREALRVIRNTVAVSTLNIATSFLPMLFAICLTELPSKRHRKLVQTVTTFPNFISWVLVYALAFAMFSSDNGLINNLLKKFGVIDTSINFLASSDHVWLQMWLYSMWKGLGWGSIVYIAGISSIDQQLYEAASIDGAGRFQRIWHITIPSLMPTFIVLLVLSIGNFINNGMDQYFVFQNPFNKEYIEVLDLYVYNQGITGSNISYSTAIGMAKSLISVFLVFIANTFSKKIRGENVI